MARTGVTSGQRTSNVPRLEVFRLTSGLRHRQGAALRYGRRGERPKSLEVIDALRLQRHGYIKRSRHPYDLSGSTLDHGRRMA